MEQRYSEMSVEELQKEMAALKEKSIKAEQMGMVNELAVYERKWTMAKAYSMDPSQFKAGEVYELDATPGESFKIEYLRGVFAWGNRGSGVREQKDHAAEEDLEALPISLLGKKLS
ncbi:YfhH family protein [Bacillaceae bacterium S4-13-58]